MEGPLRKQVFRRLKRQLGEAVRHDSESLPRQLFDPQSILERQIGMAYMQGFVDGREAERQTKPPAPGPEKE